MNPKIASKLKSIAEKISSVKTSGATDAQFEEFLADVLYASEDIDNVRTFEEAGVLSSESGLVVSYDGEEYQVTIVGGDEYDDED